MTVIGQFVAYFLGALWFLLSNSTFNTWFLQEDPKNTFIIKNELEDKSPFF